MFGTPQDHAEWLDTIVEDSWRVDLPAPAPAAEARDLAAAALYLVEPGAADGRRAYNAKLNAALDPLRRQPAVGLICRRCREPLGFIALRMQGAFVMSGNVLTPPKLRYGGEYDLGQLTEHSGRNEGWVDDASAGRGHVFPLPDRPGVWSGFNERRQYRCSCGAAPVKTNTELLRLYLGALAAGFAFNRKRIPLD